MIDLVVVGGAGVIIGAIAVCLLILAGGTTQFMTDQECNNLTQQSFINGTSFGMEYALIHITNQSIQCNQIPITYQNISYILYPLECLNLNNKEAQK